MCSLIKFPVVTNPETKLISQYRLLDLVQHTVTSDYLSNEIVLYVLYCIVLYCIVLCCVVLYCIVLYCIVLYCIVLYRIVLYCIVLCCVVLYRL